MLYILDEMNVLYRVGLLITEQSIVNRGFHEKDNYCVSVIIHVEHIRDT